MSQPPTPGTGILAPEVRDAVRRAWAEMLDEAEIIADAITLELFDREDFYRSAPAELRDEIRTSTRRHVRAGILTMAGQAAPDDRAIHVWRETGLRRAQQGVPLEYVLNAYSYGARALWEAILQHRGLAAQTQILMGQQLWSSLDVQNATACESYRREEALLQRRDLQQQMAFLDGLAQGRGAERDYADEAHRVLGLGSDEDLLAVVALADDGPGQPGEWIEEALGALGIHSYWLQRTSHAVGLVDLGGRPAGQVLELLQPQAGGRAATAACREGLSGFASAGQLALRAAISLPRGRRELVDVRERLPEVLLASSPEATGLLVQETLGRLLQQPQATRRVLLETLGALLRHGGSPTHAGQELFCHRNTVIYRLKQIEQLTGRSLSSPRDRLMMVLATIALREEDVAPDTVGA